MTYDLLGRGFSSNHSSERFGLDEHLDQLHGIVEPIINDFDSFHIIGHSQGGAITAGYAAEYSHKLGGKLKTVHLLSPAGLLKSMALDLLRVKYICNLHSCVKPLIMSMKTQRQRWPMEFINQKGEAATSCVQYLEASHADETYHVKITEAIWSCLLEFPMCDMYNEVVKLRDVAKFFGGPRVCLYWGTKDHTTPFENSKEWTNIFEGDDKKSSEKYFQFTTFEDLGHAFLLERPDLLKKAITDNLDICP